MMPVVRELLEIYQIKDMKVVTGAGGLDNRVGTVTVMEVPEVAQFLRGDDFLITSLYSIGNDVEKQCRLVKDLLKTKSACLAIKLGKYAKKISEEMLEIADKNDFPILLIPSDMTYIQIIMSVMNVILTEKNMEEILEKLIQDILFQTYSDEKIMIERGRILDIDLKNDVFQTVVIQPAGKKELDEKGGKMLKFMSRQLLAYVRSLKLIETCSLLNLKNHAVLVIEGKSKEDLEKGSVFLKAELLKRMKSGFHHSSWKMGMGCTDSGLEGIRRSYETALKVIETGAILKENEDIYTYGELEIYCQLREMMIHNPVNFYQEVLGKIQNEELTKTLETYYDCECSMEETAKVMFTHKNTIKYRIKKIRDLTGLDVKKQEDSFKIYLMLLEKKLKGK